MTTLVKVWGWIKLNAIVLAVAAAVCAAATAFSYFKGREHGADVCEARYEKQISSQKDDVIQRLIDIQAEQKAQRDLWDTENDATDAEVKEKIVYVDRVVEKTREVPVTVVGPCDVDYDGVARMFDAASDPASALNY